MRALVSYTSRWQDEIVLAKANGGDADMAERMNDLLLPIVKGVGSERSYEMLAVSLQTLGGSGYLQDYPIEQYIRDAKIDTLYEGTTAIQGLDFFFRKMVRPVPGRHQDRREITETVKGDAGGGELLAERELPAPRGRHPEHHRHPRWLADEGAGEHPGDVSGRSEHHPVADDGRRSGDRLAAAAAGRGGSRQARHRGSVRA
jgi:hypothetical protein